MRRLPGIPGTRILWICWNPKSDLHVCRHSLKDAQTLGESGDSEAKCYLAETYRSDTIDKEGCNDVDIAIERIEPNRDVSRSL